MIKYLLKKEDIHKGNLILVNKQYKLDKSFKFDNEFFSNEYKNILINKTANKYLQIVLKEINENNSIVPVSGFRTLEEQIKIFNDSLEENGEEFTYKYVALPNASEHQTGLAIDVGLNKKDIDFIRPSFPHNKYCNKFRELANKNGFIERYKENKKSITCISAEEWHFRYIGYPHSEIMEINNFCLEEYIEYLKQKDIKYKNYEISYIPYKNKPIELELNDNDTVSGNNIDGFIITRRLK